MIVEPTPLEGLLLLRPRVHRDSRGYFAETFRAEWSERIGLDRPFVQDNHSYSAESGVLRGLHFQRAPAAQPKLVRVVIGRVFDVAVDLRRGSPTFGHHFTIELGGDDLTQLFVPAGFAHGFFVLEPGTHVSYRLAEYYEPEREGGVRWDDPELGIAWPGEPKVISDRDRGWPSIVEIEPL